MDAPTVRPKGPRVIVIGGGFGGLEVARALSKASANVILISKNNHYLFQPLLYQVATSMLAPAEIATPLRQILGKQCNCTVALGEATGIDFEKKEVFVNYLISRSKGVKFDYLVLATGASHNYFGNKEFETFAPGLKTASDGNTIRDRILRAFEYAELEDDPEKHQDLLTFVLIGAGPTGVELAGAIAELRRYTLASEFRRMKPANARVILVQSGPRILPSFHEDLSKAAHKQLESLGVEIKINSKVTAADARGVVVNGERIMTRTVIWTAGVAPSLAGKWLGAELDKAGRIKVDEHCEVPGFPGVFAVGDTAAFKTDDGKPLPGVAQVAIQQGAYVGKLIHRRILGQKTPAKFKYFDKGSLAVVGRNFAVMEAGKFRSAGFIAWIAWALVHVVFLGAQENRIRVMTQWLWSYFTKQQGSRLIFGPGGKVPLLDPEEKEGSAENKAEQREAPVARDHDGPEIERNHADGERVPVEQRG